MDRIRKIKLLHRLKELFLAKISLSAKLSLLLSIIVSHTRHIVLKRKSIRYLGRELTFDNIATPLSLMTYPYEVTQKVKSNMNSETKINSLLDIGGNIGQFSLTFDHVFSPKVIDIIEPNGDIFTILEKNIKSVNSATAYNVGIGPKGKKKLHFENNRSGLGSIMEGNGGRKDRVKSLDVKLVSSIKNLTGKKEYDMIKIDVEGFEAELLKNIQDVSCKYMFIEVSGIIRQLSDDQSQIFTKIAEVFGPFNVVYVSEASRDTPSFEMLLEF